MHTPPFFGLITTQRLLIMSDAGLATIIILTIAFVIGLERIRRRR